MRWFRKSVWARHDRYELGILNDPQSRGGSKAIFDHVRVGDILRASAPRNHFPLVSNAGLTVMLAGGIGVTPFLAMAHHLQATGKAFRLHYCTRSQTSTVFMDVIADFAPNVLFHRSAEGTRLRSTDLPTPDSSTHVYLCGSERFIVGLEAEARASGHAPENIHREFFNAEIERGGQSFVVEARTSGKSVEVAADEPITKALSRIGIKVEVKCEEGVCGTCISDVVAGSLDHRDRFLTDEEKESNTLLALCCSRARGRLVLDL